MVAIRKVSKGRLLGRFFAASRECLREVAAHLGVHHLANLGRMPCTINRLEGGFCCRAGCRFAQAINAPRRSCLSTTQAVPPPIKFVG